MDSRLEGEEREAAEHDALLAGLTDQQREAVVHDAGPLMVLAGPGTGKTKLITHRVAYMIQQRGVPAESIVALTYTRAACGQLRERVAKLLERFDLAQAASEVTIETYHAFGMKLMRRFSEHVGLESDFDLIDSAQMKSLVREVMIAGFMPMAAGQGLGEVMELVHEVGEHLSNHAITPAEAAAFARESLTTIEADVEAMLAKESQQMAAAAQSGKSKSKSKSKPAAEPVSPEMRQRLIDQQHVLRMMLLETCEALVEIDKRKRQRGVVTFGDLITMPIEVIKTSPRARDIIRGTYRACVVDEFQDVNAATIEMIHQLFPGRGMGSGVGSSSIASTGPDLCVVGDDDQAIYGFRGSDDQAFARAAKLYPGIHSIALTTNYRSHKPILDAAQAIIHRSDTRFAPSKVLEQPAVLPPHLQTPPRPVVIIERENHRDRRDEGAIVDYLAQYAGPEVDWSQYAVLTRSRSDMIRIRDGLRSAGLPCRVIGRDETGAMDDLAVQDLVMLARLTVQGDDVEAWSYLLSRPVSGLSPGGGAGKCSISPLEQSDLINQFQTLRSFSDEDRKALASIAITQVTTGDLLTFAIDYFKVKLEDPQLRSKEGEYARLIDLLEKFAARLQPLRSAAVIERASEVLVRMAIEFDVVHSDWPLPEQRAARLEAVVGFLSFARRRQERLEAPGNLAAFVRYLADLDDQEKENLAELSQRVGVEDAMEQEQSTDDAAKAITLMTAHASKGLEFPYVIIATVDSHGFPNSRRSRSDLADLLQSMAARVLGASAVEPLPPAMRQAGEERRLFYVAITRAQQQVILSGYMAKNGGGYLPELFGAMGSSRNTMQILTHEALASASAASDAPLTQLVRLSREHLADEAVMHQKFAALRKQAAAIFQRICMGDAKAADELQLISKRTLEVASELPVVIADDAQDGPSITGFTSRRTQRALRLDTRRIELYLRCPACYYIRYELGLTEPISPKLQLGSVAHLALQQFYNAWSAADAAGEPLPSTEDLVRIGQRRLRALALKRSEALDETQMVQLSLMLRAAHDHMHPAAGEPVHILERELGLTINHTTPSHPHLTHQISLRADRLDQLAETSPFYKGPGSLRLIDYKTGQAATKLIDIKPEDVQLGLYAWGLDQRFGLDGQIVDGIAEYWLLGARKIGRIPLESLSREAIRDNVTTVIDGILEGQFERGKKCEKDDSPCRLLYSAAMSMRGDAASPTVPAL